MSSKDWAAERRAEWRNLLQKTCDDLLRLRTCLVQVGPQMLANRAEVLDQIAANWLTTAPRSLREAFSYFGLDVNNATHAGLLLVILADTAFGRRKKAKGRRKGTVSWNPA